MKHILRFWNVGISFTLLPSKSIYNSRIEKALEGFVSSKAGFEYVLEADIV